SRRGPGPSPPQGSTYCLWPTHSRVPRSAVQCERARDRQRRHPSSPSTGQAAVGGGAVADVVTTGVSLVAEGAIGTAGDSAPQAASASTSASSIVLRIARIARLACIAGGIRRARGGRWLPLVPP